MVEGLTQSMDAGYRAQMNEKIRDENKANTTPEVNGAVENNKLKVTNQLTGVAEAEEDEEEESEFRSHFHEVKLRNSWPFVSKHLRLWQVQY